MIKTLNQAKKMDREKFKIPRSVQQAIPIQRIWQDGIFQVGNKFSKSFRFSDINYSIASKADKTEMFLDYSELLNALDSGASAKITLNNRRINKEEFEESLLIPMKGDGLDGYREEYNEMLLSKVSGTNNSIQQERYLTISVHKKNVDEARTYFARVGTDIVTHLAKLSSVAEELDAEERLQIFRDFFRAEQPQCYPFDLKAFARKGSSFKNWICPDSMEFHKDYFKLDERYGQVLYMQDYASYIKDNMISELCDLSRDLMLSIDILPVPTDEAVKEIQNRLLGVETNVTSWQRRQNANNNFSAVVPYDMELQRKETKEMDGVELAGLEEVLRQSDAVSIHVPYTEETHHMINKETLAVMKPAAVIVNTARGNIIDEEALYEALKSGRIAGAGVDVFAKEPLPVDSPLLTLENAVLTPHVSSQTVESLWNIYKMAIDISADFFAGKGSPHILNPDYAEHN